MFSHASETYYKHPLSELVLDVLYENKPQWFDKDSVEWNGSDGTLKLPFSIDEQDGGLEKVLSNAYSGYTQSQENHAHAHPRQFRHIPML